MEPPLLLLWVQPPYCFQDVVLAWRPLPCPSPPFQSLAEDLTAKHLDGYFIVKERKAEAIEQTALSWNGWPANRSALARLPGSRPA